MYLDRLKESVPLFNAHSELAKDLLNLEASSENTLGKTSQSILAVEQIIEALPENRENINKNLANLRRRLSR